MTTILAFGADDQPADDEAAIAILWNHPLQAFDPVRHDAVAVRDAAGAADGSVVEVIRPGYGEGDHQLRPAQVVVARPG